MKRIQNIALRHHQLKWERFKIIDIGVGAVAEAEHSWEYKLNHLLREQFGLWYVRALTLLMFFDLTVSFLDIYKEKCIK